MPRRRSCTIQHRIARLTAFLHEHAKTAKRGNKPAMAANTKKAAECSHVCNVRKTRFATAPDANRTAIAAEDAGAFTAIEKSSAHSTQNTAAAAQIPFSFLPKYCLPWLACPLADTMRQGVFPNIESDSAHGTSHSSCMQMVCATSYVANCGYKVLLIQMSLAPSTELIMCKCMKGARALHGE